MIVSVNSLQGKFSAQVNGIDSVGSPAVYFAFEKGNTFMKLTPIGPEQLVYRVVGGYSDSTTHTCEYTSDLNGDLTFSLKKWLQIAMTKPSGQQWVVIKIYSHVDGVDDRLDLYLNVLPGISYNDLLAPRNKEIDSLYQGHSHRTIVPPNVMISGGALGLDIIAESSYSDRSLFNPEVGTWTETAGGTTVLITPSGTRNNEIYISPKADYITFSDGSGGSRIWRMEKTDSCADIVILRWTSLTGATRQHAFPFFNISNEVEEAVGLVSTGDGFKLTKNVSNAFTIRLSGLTPYSVFYYNDMVNACDMHATIDGSGLNTDQTLAAVQGSAMVMPQGPGLYTFEAKIKFRHYDTV